MERGEWGTRVILSTVTNKLKNMTPWPDADTEAQDCGPFFEPSARTVPATEQELSRYSLNDRLKAEDLCAVWLP